MNVALISTKTNRVDLFEVTIELLNDLFASSSNSLSKSDECLNGEDLKEIEAVLAGDGDAFGRLITKYNSAIATQMRRFSREISVVEELVHDVFVEAYFSLKSFRRRSPLLHWLRKIAVRVGYRYWKQKAKRQKATLLFSQIEQDVQQFSSGGVCEPSQASEILGDLLELLSPRDRIVLTLLYWDRCSIAEAAKLLGWSAAMVKVQAYRARLRLKKLIEEAQT